MAEHTTPDTGQGDWQQFINIKYTLGEEDRPARQAHTEATLWDGMNQQELWEAFFAVSREQSDPSFPTRWCVRLFLIIPKASRALKFITQG